MTMKKRTLEQIIAEEKKRRTDNGSFGIIECKKSVLFDCEINHKSLYEILEKYVKRANEDIFFNRAMVLACWELINE